MGHACVETLPMFVLYLTIVSVHAINNNYD